MFFHRTLTTGTLFLAVFFSGSQSAAQVNMEIMRKEDLQAGPHAELNLDIGLIAGNSDLTLIKTTVRFDYLEKSAHSFLVASFQQGNRPAGVFINKGFLHLRRTQSLGGPLFLEGFVQQEYNEFIRLTNRSLAGGGIRVNWSGKRNNDQETPYFKLYSGHGFMWERERINIPTNPLTNILRSTNYIFLGWRLDKRVLFQTTGYFQPNVTRINDFRVLISGNISFAITGKLSAAIKFYTRYDNDPPADVETYDIELTNGLIYAF
jgi:hypothetical protein